MRIKINLFKLRFGKPTHVILILVLCTFLVNFLIHVKPISSLIQWKNTDKTSFSSSSVSFSMENTNGRRSPVEVQNLSIANLSGSSNVIITRRFPYKRDPLCQNFGLSLYEDDTFPPVGLVSYPGSGNTWLRHLIQLASGVYTGSFYFDVELFAAGEREVWHSGGTIIQKFHEKYSERMYLEKAVLLIREPFPSMLAFANYLEAGHTGTSFRLPFHHKDWPNFLLHSAYNWLSLAKSWIDSPISLLVIHYENLRRRPLDNVRNICNFLNHSCPHLATPCFQRKLDGSFKRVKIKSLKDASRLHRYPVSIQSVINRGIDHLNDLLRQNGLQPIPLRLYKYYSSSGRNASHADTTLSDRII